MTRAGDDKRMLLNGNEAMAVGAIAAGCKFMSAYPDDPDDVDYGISGGT